MASVGLAPFGTAKGTAGDLATHGCPIYLRHSNYHHKTRIQARLLPNYTGLTVTQLKELCRSRLLTRGGKRIDLIRRLQEYDASQVPAASAGANTSSSISRGSHGSDSTHSQSAFESAIAHDVDELYSSFGCGLSGGVDGDDDPMVGEANGGDDPGANGTATSQSVAAGLQARRHGSIGSFLAPDG